LKPTVILLHGLARTKRSLDVIRGDLRSAGYPTWAETYRSREAPIEVLASELAGHVERDLPGRPLVAVTHSMGGIVARHMCTQLKLKGIVMMAPPNQGSQAARALKDNPLFHRIYGPALRNVQHPNTWPVPQCPVAVIAGTRGPSLGTPHSWLLHAMGVFGTMARHDGVISVEETRLEEMADFATVKASHTWIMNHRDTRRMVLDFLTQGHFSPQR
jgi:pimeloyl-ACP methyl ester carboxylesterase